MAAPVDAQAPPPGGLSTAEAEARLAAEHRDSPPRGSRSYAEIVWSNVFTVFNFILGGLLAITLILGDFKDALFGGVILANTLIGIIQEVRAKRTLDRLALLVAPRGRVWRDGSLTPLPVERVVTGDLVHLEPGDQVIADGDTVAARALSLDESILTGESDLVRREPGDRVLSGSYCVAGSGDYRVEAVGAESFAERLAAEARGTRGALSPLQLDVNRILRLTVWAMVPLAALLVTSLAIRQVSLVDAAQTTVAALVPLVPEGLVLLTSLTFAVAAIRLARLGTLAQRLNAVESLASVDTVCLDKTGTLTDNRIRVFALEPAEGRSEDELREDLAVLAASVGERNATMSAIAESAPGPPGEVEAEVPFSSARKWSGLTLGGRGTLVLGAPDVLEAGGLDLEEHLRERLAEHAGERRRVVLLAESPETLDEAAETLPALRALGLVALSEGLRPDAVAAVGFLRDQGVAVKIISGDGVPTVQAVARAAGVVDADQAVAGLDLPTDQDELEEIAGRAAVFGRITPEQKRDLIASLTRRGRYVAMVGDGVNDVLALKEARLAIAMGNGSQMAKGVADLVLLSNAFATVPVAVEEGRRILRNTHRVAKLFVTKTVYAAVLLATVGLAPIAFPFLPRHLSVTSSLTIGLPAFFLALAPSSGPVRREGVLRDLLAFAAPAGIVTAATIATGYLLTRGPLDGSVAEGQSAAVILATAMGLAVVVEVERGPERRRVRPWVWPMLAGFVLLLTVGLLLPPIRDFFAVVVPDKATWGVIAACTAGGILGLGLIRWLHIQERIDRMGAPAPQPVSASIGARAGAEGSEG